MILSKLFSTTSLHKEHEELENRIEQLEKRFEQSRLWEKIHEIKKSRSETQTKSEPEEKADSQNSQKLPPLQSLKGIGPAFAEKLKAAGVKDLADLAKLSDAAIDELDKKIKGFKAREERLNWRKAAAEQL